MIKLTEEGRRMMLPFRRFGRAMLSSQDIDPLYPVLRYLQRDLEWDQALWHSFLYVAWYNLASSTAAFDLMPEMPQIAHQTNDRTMRQWVDDSWPTGIERRSNRGGVVRQHISSYLHTLSMYGGLANGPLNFYYSNIAEPYGDDDLATYHKNWMILNERIQSIWGNGRWAAYKHLEVLRRVNHIAVMAPDMGHQFSSGPREGLGMLYGHLDGQGAAVISRLDKRGLDLQARLADRGLEVDIEELETLLCNWKSMVKGKYYVGHDIDELQEQIDTLHNRHVISDDQATLLFRARSETLPHEYLGEIGGWHGVDKDRNKRYRDTGKVVLRK